MAIRVDFRLTDDEREQLAGILRCSTVQLDDRLRSYAGAALEEYARMFLGQKVFTRGSDMREYRLFLLIRHAFDNHLPHDQHVSDLFQTTSAQSRSLIRSVMSKYQYQLNDAIEATLRETLDSAQRDEDDTHLVTVQSENVVDALNRTIQSIDGTLPQVERKRGTVSTYVIKPSSYERLRERFNLAGKT